MSKLLGLRGPGIAIFALAAFALAALAGWRGYTLYAERAERLVFAQTTVAGAATYVGNYIARTIDAADLLADDTREYIAARGGLGSTPASELQAHLARRAQSTSIDDSILVLDRTGRVLAYSGSRTPPATDFTDRAWFRAHVVQGAETYIGPSVRSRIEKKVVYTYSEALRGPDGAVEGLVVVGITPTPPRPVASRAEGEPEAALWTVDGRLIAASHLDFAPNGDPLPKRPPFTTAPQGAMGFLAGSPDQIIAFRRPEGWPLLATVVLSKTELMAQWREAVRDSVILLVAAGLIMGVLAAYGARFADQDYRARLELEQTARQLSAVVADKDLLLREIHHRVKNNLQITSSLIQLQSRNFEDPHVRAAFDQTQQRLRSISLVHDVLYHENTAARVDMAVYLNELAQEVATASGAAARGVVLDVQAESVILSPGQVTPLGLVVAEVLTNAFKHAFPEGRAGTIRLRAAQTGADIEVVIRDDGAGFDPDETRKGSLGMMLISVLTRQLGGAHAFSTVGGAVFTLVFPKKP